MQSAGSPTRVAFCITDLDAGGAEHALVQLVTRLDRTRWEPFVFCLADRGTLAAELTAADVPVRCFGARSWCDLLVILRLARELRRIKPGLLQTFLHHANIAGRIAGRSAGIGQIISGIRVAEKRGRFPLWLDRATDWMVRRHVCVSPEVASFSTQRGGLSDEKIVVIPNGVDVDRFANAEAADLSQFGIPDGSMTLLFVGRLDEQKDPFRLLEAARGLLRAHSELQVLMVGEGPLRDDILAWIIQHQLEEHVHLSGWRDDVPALMRAADCFVLCSQWEGMPNVVLEAMAAALPVVTTQVEGTSALIKQHQTGILVPPKSTPELAGAIALVLADPTQARVMGVAAQDVVRKEFTWDGMVEAYNELYASLLVD